MDLAAGQDQNMFARVAGKYAKKITRLLHRLENKIPGTVKILKTGEQVLCFAPENNVNP